MDIMNRNIFVEVVYNVFLVYCTYQCYDSHVINIKRRVCEMGDKSPKKKEQKKKKADKKNASKAPILTQQSTPK